jgi:hypothetical protein
MQDWAIQTIQAISPAHLLMGAGLNESSALYFFKAIPGDGSDDR